MPAHKLRSLLLSVVIPVHRLIVMKAVIPAHFYLLSEFRITAMLLNFIMDFFHFRFNGMLHNLGSAVSMLTYEDHIKLIKGKPQKLSPLNEFS